MAPIFTPEAVTAAAAWTAALNATNPMRSLAPRPFLDLNARADARASADSASYGGWILLPGDKSPDVAWWFMETFTREDLPVGWNFSGSLQPAISAWEAVGQCALVALCRKVAPPANLAIRLRAEDDNMPSEAAIDKLFSTKPPLSHVLLHMAAWVTRSGMDIRVSHVAGVDNIWADGLSREIPEIVALFAADRRIRLPPTALFGLVGPSVLPRAAPWGKPLVELLYAFSTPSVAIFEGGL